MAGVFFVVAFLAFFPFTYYANNLIFDWCIRKRIYFSSWFPNNKTAHTLAWITFALVLTMAFNMKVFDFIIAVTKHIAGPQP